MAQRINQAKEEDRRLPVDLTREFIIEKCEYFASTGVWPHKTVIDPESWLDNFTAGEQNHAIYLLNFFMYFPDIFVDEIFLSAIRALSRTMMTDVDSRETLKQKWQFFINSAVFTFITGEIPNPTDSGHLFARKARMLGIDESMIKTPEQVCELLRHGSSPPIIIVDDFVGSGNQFLTTWNRPYGIPGRSLCELSPISKEHFFLCPAFCTEKAISDISEQCVKLTINPGHIIPNEYSVFAPDSIVWPNQLKTTATDFLESTSKRAGIPDTNGVSPNDWRGFNKLGLTIALSNSIPDATLPLFYWEENGWRPLMRRV